MAPINTLPTRGPAAPDDDCTAPEVGRRYWVWITTPAAITSGDERVFLTRHPASCPSCLHRTLLLLGAPAQPPGAPAPMCAPSD